MSKKLIICLISILAIGFIACKKEVRVAQPTSTPALQSLSQILSLSAPSKTLWWIDRDGHEEAIPLPPADYYFPNLSPDGTRLAVTVAIGGRRDIYIFNLAAGTFQRIPSEGIYNNQPIWSPDGRQIAYASRGSNGSLIKIVLQSVDIMDEPELIGSAMGEWIYPLSWSPDGKIILTTEGGPDGQHWDMGMILMDEDHPFTYLMNNENDYEIHPQISPDGKWLAYCIVQGPPQIQSHIFVSPFPDVKSGRWQVSFPGANSPRWSPDGKELYYLIRNGGNQAFVAVPVESGPTFKAGTPKVLFEENFVFSARNNGIPYAVHPDGQRFLMIKGPVIIGN